MYRSRSWIFWTLMLAAVAVAAVYFIFDPATTVWMPKCPLHLLTGWDCPGCGSQRAIHALAHGDFESAFRANALLVVMLPYLVLLLFSELARGQHPRLYKLLSHPYIVIPVAVVIVGWGILRNIIC